MKLDEIEDHIKRWVIILFLVFMLFLSILLTANLIQHVFKINSSWDVLSFLGAIIGGLLTLLGVRYTIKEQHKKDFIDKFPEKLMYSDEILIELRKIITLCEEYTKDNSHENITLLIESHESFENIVVNASKVNSKAYQLVREFRSILQIVCNLIKKDDWKISRKHHMIETQIKLMEHYFKLLLDESRRLYKKFENITDNIHSD